VTSAVPQREDAPSGITTRTFEERDLPALLRFWAEYGGWGDITEEQWRSWYLDTPLGPATIVVAEDAEGRIAGQEVFSPARAIIDGGEVRAVRLSAPILRPDIRTQSIRRMDHAAVGLYWTGINAALHAGYSLMYSRPAAAWIPFFLWGRKVAPWTPGVERWSPRVIESYGCVTIEGSALPPPPDGVTAIPCGYGPDLDDLWSRAVVEMPISCGIIRDRSWVEYRIGGNATFEARGGDGTLLGWASIDPRSGLLADYLAISPEALRLTLAATLAPAAAAAGATRIKAMTTPLVAPILNQLGFRPEDFAFAHVCDWLNPDDDVTRIAAERWYLTPID
jgi:hypothetical protein